ncbi:MAG: carboxypeptidase regulatory-like domain-containing protein [Gammaproteobacteria bacterium]|nr:carboxypeptidase regulatory-like domain-containing protein [Gammaproteobacteria bacterium]
MATRWSAIAGAVALGVAVHGTDRLEQRTALDRAGTHHGGLVVRVVDHEGTPVETTVSVSGRGSALATAATDADGRAELHGISTRHRLSVFVRGTDDLRGHREYTAGVSNGVVDLGVVRLERNFRVTGVVLQRDADGGVQPRSDDTEVTLNSPRTRGGTYYDGSAFDEDRRAAVFRLEDFDDEPDLVIGISWWSDERRGLVDYELPFTVDPERPHRHLLVTLPAEGVGGRLAEVEESVWPVGVPPKVEAPRVDIAGRLLTTGGRPLTGLPVEGYGLSDVYTDDDGRFEFSSRHMVDTLTVATPSGELSIASRPYFEGIDSDALPLPDSVALQPQQLVDFTRPFEARFATRRQLRLVVRGERGDRIAYSWFDRNEWRPIRADLLRRVVATSDEQTLVRASVPGRIDRLLVYPPQSSSMLLDFRNDEPHGFVVVGKDGPVAGAKVEVVDAAAPMMLRLRREDPSAPLQLNRTNTDAQGRFSLAADPAGLYVAYVYADGYEPARVRLVPGGDSRVVLVARDTDVRLQGVRAGEYVRLRPAGHGALVAAVRATGGDEPIAVRLSSGTYDATVVDDAGDIVRGTTFTVGESSMVVDISRDSRPRVILRLPEHRNPWGWFAGATRRLLPHEVAGISQFLREWRDISGGEEPAQVESIGPGTRVLRFPGTGRWHLHAGVSGANGSLFMEVDLAPGEVRELRLPPLDASLEGTMAYEPNLDDRLIAYHWIDGPRIMLLARPGTRQRWNVMSNLARPRSGRKPHTFAVSGVPVGDYHLFHHLAVDPGWGGMEVELAAGATTRVEGLGSRPPARLVVEVVDAAGQPIRDRILRVQGRMHKQWTAPGRIIITSGTGPRVPPPPAVRLTGEPVALESIRAGWLELVVDEPGGDARHYLRKVEPGTPLRLIVDS